MAGDEREPAQPRTGHNGGGFAASSQEESDSIPVPDDARVPGIGEAFARVVRQAAPFMAAAWGLTSALLLGSLGGWWLDRRFGTRPWLLVTGSLLGAAVGLFDVARVALRKGRGA